METVFLQKILSPSGRDCFSVNPKPFVRKTFLFRQIERAFSTRGNHFFTENTFSRLWKQYFFLVDPIFKKELHSCQWKRVFRLVKTIVL